MTVIARAGAVSHVGKVRSNNQDSGLIGEHLYAIADGMGGHAGGDVASAIVVKHLAANEREYETIEDAELGISALLREANKLIVGAVREHPELHGMGTTSDVITLVEGRIVIGHIGDSRVYRLHDGVLEQITTDHTFVPRLVDAGRITKEEAEVHPRRSVLMRVLGDVETSPEIDTIVEDAVDGDRWLICSDGLSSYVDESRIEEVLGRAAESSREIGDDLVQLALDVGAPDNVSVVVLELGPKPVEAIQPRIVSPAGNPLHFRSRALQPSKSLLPDLWQPAKRLAARPENEEFVPPSDDFLEQLIHEERVRRRWRRATWTGSVLLLVTLLVGAGLLLYNWTQTQYYVGEHQGTVAVYRGVPATIGPIRLSDVYETTDIAVDDLPAYQHMQVDRTIGAGSLDEARSIVERIRDATG